MKTEKISDVLQGMDVNTEDAIVTLSDKVWEIGELSEIKNNNNKMGLGFQKTTSTVSLGRKLTPELARRQSSVRRCICISHSS